MVALGSNASSARSEEEGILMMQKYGDDERRRAATHFSPALRVAAGRGHLPRCSSSTYRSKLVRLRRRALHLAPSRQQRAMSVFR